MAGGSEKRREITPGGETREIFEKVKKKAKENIIPDGRARQKPGSQKKSFGESEIFD